MTLHNTHSQLLIASYHTHAHTQICDGKKIHHILRTDNEQSISMTQYLVKICILVSQQSNIRLGM
jgi:hypothetical protein